MKPVPFDYIRPKSIAETCALLAQDTEARVIAGGQSSVTALAGSTEEQQFYDSHPSQQAKASRVSA